MLLSKNRKAWKVEEAQLWRSILCGLGSLTSKSYFPYSLPNKSPRGLKIKQQKKLSSHLATTTYSHHKACQLGQKNYKKNKSRKFQNHFFPTRRALVLIPIHILSKNTRQPGFTPQTPIYTHSESWSIPRGLNIKILPHTMIVC